MILNSYKNLLIVLFSFSLLQFSCKPKNDAPTDSQFTVIVQFNEDEYSEETPKNLELEFEKYDLKKIEVLSRPMHIFLFSFNGKKVQRDKLIDEIKVLTFVKEAQANRKVKPRN